jgi:hypothetical protein
MTAEPTFMQKAARRSVEVQLVGAAFVVGSGLLSQSLEWFLLLAVVYLATLTVHLDVALYRQGRLLDQGEAQVQGMIGQLNEMVASTALAVRCPGCGQMSIVGSVLGPLPERIPLPPGWGAVDEQPLCPACLVRMS